MANEILLTAQLVANKGGANASGSASVYLTLVGSEMISTVQTISTAVVAVPIGSCDTLQAILIKNQPFLSDGTTPNTANVTVGKDNPITDEVSVIPPGAAIILCGCGTTLYCKASAGTPDILVAAVET